ncbi:MAG: tRNA (N6-threonylcarbamoyladenosine(37)-N6)-methyltransferase TrmO [Bacteroidales bacterium]|nr:tRNA (N6-threonylcarbamoyladenosine(37)-N6)-methyltransferase TrmO [Bacteroidales bacterium]
MKIEPVAIFRSPISGKFGIPRQAGLAPELQGTISFIEPFDSPDALRGLEGFDYLWLIWGFSMNAQSQEFKATVRPPRLGGNERIGVFASRSPFRPNGLGLSSVRISQIDFAKGEVHVLGADLADGTPIYDVKPYIEYADSHPGVRSGFVDSRSWEPLEVVMPDNIAALFSEADTAALRSILAQDPRPQYHDDPERIYGLLFKDMDIRFKVDAETLTVVSVEERK